MVSPATSALMIASSVACAVASNKALIRWFETIETCTVSAAAAAPGLAVEKAITMSPDPFPEVAPVRPKPWVARGGSSAALEAVAAHRCATADIAFSDRARARAVERFEDMLRLDMEAVDVVQTSVIGFGDDRQQPRLLHLAMPHGPHNGCVSHG